MSDARRYKTIVTRISLEKQIEYRSLILPWPLHNALNSFFFFTSHTRLFFSCNSTTFTVDALKTRRVTHTFSNFPTFHRCLVHPHYFRNLTTKSCTTTSYGFISPRLDPIPFRYTRRIGAPRDDITEALHRPNRFLSFFLLARFYFIFQSFTSIYYHSIHSPYGSSIPCVCLCARVYDLLQ